MRNKKTYTESFEGLPPGSDGFDLVLLPLGIA